MRKLVLYVIVGLLVCAGSATAAATITGKQVKNSSLTGLDVKNRSLKAADLSRSTVRSLRGQRGATGASGPQGPAGPTVLGRTVRVEASTTIAPADVDSATVNCPPGYGLVSGSYSFIAADGEVFYGDDFGSGTSWSVGGDNFDSSVEGDLTAIAYCAPAGAATTTARSLHSSVKSRAASLVARQKATH